MYTTALNITYTWFIRIIWMIHSAIDSCFVNSVTFLLTHWLNFNSVWIAEIFEAQWCSLWDWSTWHLIIACIPVTVQLCCSFSWCLWVWCSIIRVKSCSRWSPIGFIWFVFLLRNRNHQRVTVTMSSLMMLILGTHMMWWTIVGLCWASGCTTCGVWIASDYVLGNEMLIVHSPLLN